MPATAGRVRMPANNRVHSSAALQTHGIWQSAIGYDPYAPEKDSKEKSSGGNPEADGRAENAYASFQGLLALARITGSSANDTRGACKKCGRVGHLTYQCRNFLSVKEDKEKDEATLQNATVVFDKIKKANGMKEEKESSEEEDSDSSDSDADPEIERIIAARSGKNRKKVDKDDGSKEKKRERRGRSKKRSGKRARRGYDDDDDGDKEDDAKIKEKRHRRRYASSDEDSSEDERGRKVKKLRKRHAGSDDDGSDEDSRHRHHRKSRKERKRRSHH